MPPIKVDQLSRVFDGFSYDKRACKCSELSTSEGISQTPDMTWGRHHTPRCTAWIKKAGVNPQEFTTVYMARQERIRKKVEEINDFMDNVPMSRAMFFSLNERENRIALAHTRERWDRYEGDGSLEDIFQKLFTSIKQALSRS